MKSILFLIPSLGGGGAERVLINMVNNIDRTKFDVTVQTIFDVGVNKQFIHKDVKYIGGFPYMFRGNIHVLKLFSPTTLYNHIVGKRYDIVVSYLEGLAARIISGCPYKDSKKVSWIHVEQHTNKRFAESFRSLNEAKRCYKSFDKVICVAETVKKDFEKFVDVNCEVLYNVNEEQQILSMGEEKVDDLQFSQDINLISVAKLEYAKGFDRLIGVHKKLLEAGLKNQVYILGSGSEEGSLKRKVKSLGVQNTFHFLGFKVNPYKYVSKADLYICSSRREGFSTAVTEALYLGIPVVSTCCSGAKELLGENNEYGIVVENSEEGIYEGLFEMLSDPQLLEKYRRVSILRGEEFSKSKNEGKIELMFESL